MSDPPDRLERFCEAMWDGAVAGTQRWADRSDEQRQPYRLRVWRALAAAGMVTNLTDGDFILKIEGSGLPRLGDAEPGATTGPGPSCNECGDTRSLLSIASPGTRVPCPSCARPVPTPSEGP